VGKTCCSSFQSDATEEEDGEDNIGEHSGEINNLTRGGDTLHKNEVDNDPGQDETKQSPVLDTDRVINTARTIQSCSEPEVLSLTRVLTLSYCLVRLCHGARRPGQLSGE